MDLGVSRLYTLYFTFYFLPYTSESAGFILYTEVDLGVSRPEHRVNVDVGGVVDLDRDVRLGSNIGDLTLPSGRGGGKWGERGEATNATLRLPRLSTFYFVK